MKTKLKSSNPYNLREYNWLSVTSPAHGEHEGCYSQPFEVERVYNGYHKEGGLLVSMYIPTMPRMYAVAYDISKGTHGEYVVVNPLNYNPDLLWADGNGKVLVVVHDAKQDAWGRVRACRDALQLAADEINVGDPAGEWEQWPGYASLENTLVRLIGESVESGGYGNADVDADKRFYHRFFSPYHLRDWVNFHETLRAGRHKAPSEKKASLDFGM